MKNRSTKDEERTVTEWWEAPYHHRDLCLTVAMEEMAELQQAISKLKRGKPDFDNLAEEIADVRLCLRWLVTICSEDTQDAFDLEVSRWEHKKIKRMEERLKSGDFT